MGEDLVCLEVGSYEDKPGPEGSKATAAHMETPVSIIRMSHVRVRAVIAHLSR